MAATISPVLHYNDIEETVAVLGKLFGFVEHVVYRDDDGNIPYAEVVFDGCYIGIGPKSDEPSPFDLGPTGVYVALDDPDAVHDRAVAAGADIVMPITDQEYGSREFAARDHEGNVWCFGTFRPGTEPAE